MTEFELTITEKNFTAKMKCIAVLYRNNKLHISLTNKLSEDDLITIAQKIWDEFPNFHINLTYCILINYATNKEKSLAQFYRFLARYNELPEDKKTLLIVSGVRPKKLDTLVLLDSVNINKTTCSVVYNPFFDGEELVVENKRLATKLAHSAVSRVYIQIGLKIDIITKAVDYIRSLRSDIPISLCVLYPSLKLLQNLQIRPWGGVFLNRQYLTNQEFAHEYTTNLVEKCKSTWGVDLLITWLDNEKKLEQYLKSFSD